jgi:DNA-binding LacI/PurR family transcriptional regulator
MAIGMSANPSRRISYTDIAKVVGYHRSTVGLALRNHPRIPTETREKILKVANEMGYRPDPSLNSLINYRRNKSTQRGFTTIALLTDDPVNSGWREQRHTIKDYYTGIYERADELGFHIDEFSVGLEREYEKRVNQVLKSRGIRAVIVCPLRVSRLPLNIDWHRYSVVSVGFSLRSPSLLRICSENRLGAFDAVFELYRLGYRKVGLAIGRHSDIRVNFAWSAGFLSACHQPELKDLEYAIYMPHEEVSLTKPELLEWIRSSGVDCILISQDDIYAYLLKNGVRIPEELGLACLDLPPGNEALSGIDQLSREVGRQAVDQVSGLYSNHLMGVQNNLMIHAVKGRWTEGKSVRQVSSTS